ncbi:MAG TPA: hypothetical protein VL021_07580 [Brumimicrobium sp.]|nr:hypothetical protein [Brumimicrobium sp.]
MKGAVIDMGTNTFSLLIFREDRNHSEILLTDRGVVNLGEGCINSNSLMPQAIERAYRVIKKFMEECRAYSIPNNNIRAFGTSAMREACNAPELIKRLQHDFGLNITIINGQEEANIVYQGVKKIHLFNPGDTCIMDIGGGSTEFTVVHDNYIQSQKSYNIGLARLIQMFDLSDPLTAEDLTKIARFLEKETATFFTPTFVDDLIGVGGSFETYFNLVNKEFNYQSNQTYQLPLDDLFRVLDELIYSSQNERNDNIWIADFRKQMMNIAAFKTKWALQQLEASSCYFSPASLKEGIIASKF